MFVGPICLIYAGKNTEGGLHTLVGAYITIKQFTAYLVTTLEHAVHMPQANCSHHYTTVCKDTIYVQCYVCTKQKLSGYRMLS